MTDSIWRYVEPEESQMLLHGLFVGLTFGMIVAAWPLPWWVLWPPMAAIPLALLYVNDVAED